MGTVVTIDLYGEDDPGAGATDAPDAALTRARAILQEADNVFSTWKTDSPLSRLRRGEIDLEQAPAAVGDVLESCRAIREMSRGWFDPWAMPGGVDPTGYVKGWAAQRALDTFRSTGIRGALVNAAGDVASFGGLEDGQPFRIAIVDPRSPNRFTCIVELVGAVATSGTYERGDHLVDPHTGRLEARLASATVSGPDLGLADALATALAVAGPAGLPMIEELEGYEALAIDFDGAWRWTEYFPFASPTPSRPTCMSDGLQLSPGYVRVSS